MAERQIGHWKSSLVLSARFPALSNDVRVLLLNQPKKKILKIGKFTLFTYSLVGSNFENLYKYAVSIFCCFAQADILSAEKSVFWKAYFLAKQELITRTRRLVQEFATTENFSRNKSHDKEFYVF